MQDILEVAIHGAGTSGRHRRTRRGKGKRFEKRRVRKQSTERKTSEAEVLVYNHHPAQHNTTGRQATRQYSCKAQHTLQSFRHEFTYLFAAAAPSHAETHRHTCKGFSSSARTLLPPINTFRTRSPIRLQHHLIDSLLLQDGSEASAGGHDGEAAGVAATTTRPRRPVHVQGG